MGLTKNLKNQIKANSFIVITALTMDAIILSFFVWVKATTDVLVVIISIISILIIFLSERWF